MWRVIGSAIGSFLASIFGSFWHDQSVKKAATDQVHAENENADTRAEIQTVEKSNEVRDEIDAHAVPADIAQRVRAQYVDR